ncbi:MAG: C40 family peptidase [Mycobacteriales bacterium]
MDSAASERSPRSLTSPVRILVPALAVCGLVMASTPAYADPASSVKSLSTVDAQATVAELGLKQAYATAERYSEAVNAANARLAVLDIQIAGVNTQLTEAQAKLAALPDVPPATTDPASSSAGGARQATGPAGAPASPSPSPSDTQPSGSPSPSPSTSTSGSTGPATPATPATPPGPTAAQLEAIDRADREVARLQGELSQLTTQRTAAAADLATNQQALSQQAAAIQARMAAMSPAVRARLAAYQAYMDAANRAAWADLMAKYDPAKTAAGKGMHPGPQADAAVRFALAQLGVPYVWGGESRSGYDCSGLVQASYASAGVGLPRVSRDQFWAGTHIGLADLLPGDLMFWADNPSDPATIHHVAMYIGQGMVVEAPEPGDVVKVVPVWFSGFAGAVRVVPAVGGPAPKPVPIPQPQPQPKPQPQPGPGSPTGTQPAPPPGGSKPPSKPPSSPPPTTPSSPPPTSSSPSPSPSSSGSSATDPTPTPSGSPSAADASPSASASDSSSGG